MKLEEYKQYAKISNGNRVKCFYCKILLSTDYDDFICILQKIVKQPSKGLYFHRQCFDIIAGDRYSLPIEKVE